MVSDVVEYAMTGARRKLLMLVAVCATATLFQGFPAGCGQYFATAGITSIDFCSIFNCESSTFFNLCSPVPLLADCPTLTGGGG